MQLQPSGQPAFYDPRGLPVPDAPPAIRLGDDAAESLVQQNLLRGIDPDFRSCSARYRRENDIPWPVIVRAVEALDAMDASDTKER